MERNPFSQPDSSGNKDSGKDKKAPAAFNVVPTPQYNTTERAPAPVAEQRIIPVAPAFEGVISWRDRGSEDMRSRQDSAELAKPTETKESNDGEEKKDGKSKTKQDALELVQPEEHRNERPVAAPRPFDEVIAESVQPATTEKQGEENTEENEQSIPESGVFAFPQPPRREYDPIRRSEQQRPDEQLAESSGEDERPEPPIFAPGTLANYPPVAPRQESVPQNVEQSQPLVAQSQESVPAWQPEAAQVPQNAEYAAMATQDQEALVNGTSEEDQDAATYPQPVVQANSLPGYAPGVGLFNQAPPVQGANPNVAPIIPGGGTPNQPPLTPNIPPNGGGNMPPVQPGFNPNNPYNPYNPTNAGPNYNAAPSAPIMPLERPAAIAGANRDPRVGPVAALLGLEYLARKRADRKLEKRLAKRNDAKFKQQERLMNDNALRMQEQQRQFAAEQARQGKEMNQMQYGSHEAVVTPASPRPFETVPQASASTVTGAERPHVQAVTSPNQQPRFYNNQPERPGQPMTMAEMRRQPTAERVQQIQNIEAQQENEQNGINVAPNQHVEHSSWHNIVVDERGHEVQGAIEYGQGFQSELAKEAVRSHGSDDSTSDNTAGATAGIVGYGAAPQGQYTNPMLPSGMTNPALPQGHSTHVDPQHQLEANNRQASNFTNPWFWIMLLLIIAAFFTAALV